MTRRLVPGAMLSEADIAAELSMGRTPVREALARLAWIGFVEVHPRRGVQVANADIIRHLNHVYFEKRIFSSLGSRWSLTQRRSAMTKGSRFRRASKSATRRVRSSALAWQW